MKSFNLKWIRNVTNVTFLIHKKQIWSSSGGNKITGVITGRSNVFLITNSKAKILIDTGPGFTWNTLQKSWTVSELRKLTC